MSFKGYEVTKAKVAMCAHGQLWSISSVTQQVVELQKRYFLLIRYTSLVSGWINTMGHTGISDSLSVILSQCIVKALKWQ